MIFLFSFTMTQITKECCSCFSFIRVAKRMSKNLKTVENAKSVLAIFYVETYIDLVLGGLVNTENDYLFEVKENWGPNGNLNFSD